MELLIPLDLKAKTALYEQIYAYIRGEIRNGSLKAEERLPSTRVLAENLKVSRSTTQMAYDQLLAEGYLVSRPYRGILSGRIEGLVEGASRENRRWQPVSRRDRTAGLIFHPEGLIWTVFPTMYGES